jgi:hypothetical protein
LRKVCMNRTTYAYWIRGREFAEFAAKSIESIKRFDRFMVERRFVVVTDEAPEIVGDTIQASWRNAFTPDVEIHLIGRGHRPAMVANLDAQLEVLHNTPHGERVLFLDADTICLKPFPWSDADLHVTWRPDVNGDVEMARQQPYNYGVLGATVTQATIEAFYWMRARIQRMSPERQKWYGNQLALEQLLGQPNRGKERRIRWTLQDEGMPLTVQELPCAIWNYSPSNADEDVSGKGILHFKGGRKDLIEAYTRAAA